MDSFWEVAEGFLEQFEYEKAVKVYEEALKTNANDPEILDALGDTLLLMGNADQALRVLNISLKLAPESGPIKFLNLAQLHEGKEALNYYNKAIELLNKQKKVSSREEVEQLNEKLVASFCAVAEIYMTDECMREDAEEKCEEHLKNALAIQPNNTEALQLMASFKISQQNNEEALQFLQTSLLSWNKLDPEDRPPYEFRLQTAKLFIEVEGYENAAEVLEMLLEEYDGNAEVWYLLGLVETYSDPESALENLNKAREILVKTKCSEPEIFGQVDVQIKKAKEKIAKLPPKLVTESMNDEIESGDDNVNENKEMDTTL